MGILFFCDIIVWKGFSGLSYLDSILYIFLDDLSEDLSLGLILDDRDDSLFGGTWSDEEDDACTPTKHLPTLGMFFQNFVRIQNMFLFMSFDF